LALPAASKYVIDEVMAKRRSDLLLSAALAVGAAALLQAVTSFLLSQALGISGRR